MTAREQAIEAGARALQAKWEDVSWPEIYDEAITVIDAAEPIIRADQIRTDHDGRECVCARTEAESIRADRERLRAQVEALTPSYATGLGYDTALRDVLRLLDGEPEAVELPEFKGTWADVQARLDGAR